MLSREFHSHLNTTILQERHRKLYEELYRACPTVVSAPAVLMWSPTYAVGPGGVGIVSKLPLRLHIGIEPRTDGKYLFGPTRCYLPERDEFADWDQTRCNPLLLQLFAQVARQHGLTGGARFWCLSEVPWYRGLNLDPLYAVPAAAAWLLYLGAITPIDLSTMVNLPTERLAGTPSFEKVFRLAWKVESIIANTLADGHMVFASLIDSQYPVLFFRERDPFLFDHYRDYGLAHPSSYYNVSDGLFFRGVRMNELWQLDPNPAWPIDMALVFTGEEGDTRFVYKIRGAFKAKLDEVAALAEQTLIKLVPETFRHTPRFLELASEGQQQSAGMNLFQIYRESSVVHSLTVLKTIRDLFQYGASPEVLRDFLHNQNICQHLLRILGLSPFSLSRPQTMIRVAATRHTEVGVATRLSGPGNHGCLLVLGPINTLGAVLAEALPEVQASIKKPTHCHWASWCDGNTAYAGARVEQYIQGGSYSPFISSKSITVREWPGATTGATNALLYTADKWEAERAQFDVLFDGKAGRVWVRGQALNSEQIHSAKQTIELFRQLFNKGANEVGSEDLPASCYRADRNQMESKIIRPLLAAIKQLTGKNLGLEIHGGLGSKYRVLFNPSAAVRVGLVEKQ